MKYNLNDFQFVEGDNKGTIHEGKDPYNSLAEEDLSIIKAWKGLSPQRVSQKMCEHFKESYPDWERDYRWCGEGLFEPGKTLNEVAFPKGNTWEELEANLKQVTRRFVMNEQLFEYWDVMRGQWHSLRGDPGQKVRRQVYRKWNKRKDGRTDRQLVKMEMCSLCWRAVPVREGVTSKVLCHNHNWASTNPDYRRRFRMKYGKTPHGDSRERALNDRYQELLHPLKEGKTVTYSSNRKNDKMIELRIKDAWNIAPFLIIQLLPHVYDYLLANDADMTSSMSIIQTLEAPLPLNEKDDEIAMRSEFYKDRECYFRPYVKHLIWAEIWLELEANTQRGGRRPGAGRKPKK